MADMRTAEARRMLASRVGISVFLCSWAMVFVALLFAHALLRARMKAEPPPLPIALAVVNSLVLVASTALARCGRNDLRRTRGAAALAATAGTGFLALQGLLWRTLAASGLVPTESQLAASIYALSGFHAVHVAIGIGGLWWVAIRRPAGLAWWRLYWDFVGLAWLAIFAVGFLW